jgi:hypothetical protein
MFVGFRMYRAASPHIRNRLRFAGTSLWALGCFWSFENIVWTSLTWLGFLVVEAAVDLLVAANDERRARAATICRDRLLAVVVLPALVLACVDGYYVALLHHLPDWRGFFEFSSIYSDDASYRLTPATFGSGWLIIIVLAAIGTMIVAVTRAKRYDAIPVVALAWLALWATATYYLGEPFNDHIALLAPIIVTTIAICLAVGDGEQLGIALRSGTALAFMPYCVLLLAYAVPGTKPLLATRGPSIGNFVPDVLAHAPTMPQELVDLERRAGIRTADTVLFPSDIVWVKSENGMILPFLSADGKIVDQQGWLPFNQTGMINTMITLPLDRQETYIERFLARTRTGGWYVTYRHRPDCATLSPHLATTRVVDGVNFHAAICRYLARAASPNEVF